MSLIKDLKNVKDEEISLQDVQRAEEIIARANKLLGRKETCHHHYGWGYVQPYISPFYNAVNTVGNFQTLKTGGTSSLTMGSSITDASSLISNIDSNATFA